MDLNIRKIDTELVAKAKLAASELDWTLRKWVITVIERALADRKDLEPASPPPVKADDDPPAKPEWIRDVEIPGKLCGACGSKIYRVISCNGSPQVHWRCGGKPPHLIKVPPEAKELEGIF